MCLEVLGGLHFDLLYFSKSVWFPNYLNYINDTERVNVTFRSMIEPYFKSEKEKKLLGIINGLV
jgi:hypothetical protein